MKKALFNLLFLGLANFALAQAVDVDATQVPKTITEKFTHENPGTSVAWKVEGRNYKAYYTDASTNVAHIVVYDYKGNVLRRENELDRLSYPANIGSYYEKNFPGEPYRIWAAPADNTGANKFYSERNSQIIWFDQNGNPIAPKAKQPSTK